jgi:membrane protease YdiL (CAAX protease family)
MTAQPQDGLPLVPGAEGKGFTYFVRRHPVPSYYALTFVISWGLMGAVIGVAPVPMAVAVSLGPVGPAAASIILTSFLDGKAGLRELGARLRRWRVGARWYALALLTAPLVMASASVAVAVVFPGFYGGVSTAGELVIVVLAGIAVGLIVGVLEELGWTGFALPRLRRRHGVVSTALIMAVLWGAWHYPMFANSADPSGAIPSALIGAVFLFGWLPAYRVLMVWLYDRTGSLPLAMLMHAPLSAGAFINSFMAASGNASGIAILVPSLSWGAAFWVVAAVVLLTERRHPWETT